MNKLFTKIAALCLGATMAVGVGVAVASNSKVAEPVSASTSSYVITFKDTGTSSDGTAKKTAISDLVSSGSEYIASLGTTNNLYQAKSGYGIKGGGGSAKGMIVINWNTTDYAVKPTSIVAKIAIYNNSKDIANGVLWGYNSSTSTAAKSGGSTLTDYTIDLDGSTNLTSITVAGKQASNSRFYLERLTINYEVTPAKTLSSITVSSDHRSFTVGDTFVKETVTAHYSDSSTATVTNSASFSGYNMSTAGGQTVSVSYSDTYGSASTTYSITVSAPATPFITPAKNSTSGYTGQNESLSFTYGNLTGSLNVTSSNTSVVTVETPSTSAGSGTVQINFVGAGSTTVLFMDGSTQRASVSVTVKAPTVTITGMPASRSIASGGTVDLGALITVTPTGGLSSDVTWSTSNSGIASVTQAGVVTGESAGNATITVTPDDYPAGAVSCTVTVANVLTAVFGTTGSNSSTEVTDASKYRTDYNYTIDSNITLSDISKVYPQDSNALKFGSSSVVGSMTFSIPSTINSKAVYITNVTVRAVRYHETKGTTMLIGGVEKTLTYTADDYTADLSSGEATSFVLTADSSSSDKRMFIQSISIEYAFKKTLSSIALSGTYQTTFTKGDTFNHDGMVVTATYSDSSTADVTSSATFSGYNLSNTGNQTVTVSYTEGTTKTTTYSITVNYAAVSSLTIGSNTGKVVTNEYFDMSEISVTILPANANPAYTWSVLSNTVNDDFEFDADIVAAGNTEGTITLKCASDADASKYQTFVLTVSGNPVISLPSSVTLYTGKTTTVTASVEGGSTPYTYSWSITSGGSYASITSGGSSATVTLSGTAAGSVTLQCTVTDSNSKSDSASVTFNVIASAVTAVNWSASSYDVFSGATIPSNIDDTWMVNYEKNNGDAGYILFGDYDLYLGSEEITSLPYTFKAADSGKSLHVEYGGVSSSSVSVTVTQTINAVYAPNTVTDTVSWTASAAADLGSQISSEGDTDTGTISTGTYSWNYTRTLTSLTSGKSDNISFQGSTWIQLGSNNSMESIEFSTSEIPGTIKSVTVVVATAGSHELTIDVGGTKYLEDESLHLYSGTAAAANPDPDDCIETGTGSSSGAITITIAPTASTKKAMVIRSISVTYETGGSGKTNIANDPAHKAAQRAAVAYAQAFNAAMDETENCTTGLDAAWSTCASAYQSFKSAAAALGETEEAWAKNLVKYATAQYSDDSGEACLERMMKTYEICVQKHGKTAFMSDLVTLGRAPVNPIAVTTNENINTIAIVVIVSVISVSAIGGYFFLRKRKETN